MTRPARRVALTGGLASGKSHCLAAFARLGAPTIDADALAHAVLAPSTPGAAAVALRFGPAVVLPDGSLDRQAIASRVFSDEEARRALEGIVHPAVYRAIDDWFLTLPPGPGIADVPLLFETGHEPDFDRIIVAACSPEQQLARAIARGLPPADARARIAAQWPLEEKARRADDVIDTSGTFAETEAQVGRIWRRLTASL
jgi:dephospho-CoA kinase